MASIVKVPITNVVMGGDYTGQIHVGPDAKPMNVILDTGSSAFAVDGHKYAPDLAKGDKGTNYLQADSYGDGSSWLGAVIESTVTAGTGAASATLPNANVAVAYQASASMFRGTDGILGLAYAPLDDAYQMPEPTWPKHYTKDQLPSQPNADLKPYLTQLAEAHVVADKVSFYTLRSFKQEGKASNDPINQGWMFLGGAEASNGDLYEAAKDLYMGTFQVAKVLTDEWYTTHLKSVRVGAKTIRVPARGPKGMPTNSIVDSGTNSLNLGPKLLKAILGGFSSSQRALLERCVVQGELVANGDVGDLASWPDLTFVLQGLTADVTLVVAPRDYWQLDTSKVGAALAAITPSQDELAILGLPLMNGYFTVFDGEADGGKGTINFAPAKR